MNDLVPPERRRIYLIRHAEVSYFSEAGAKTTLKALASFNPNIKPEAINLGQTYTNEFVKKAHAKYGKKK